MPENIAAAGSGVIPGTSPAHVRSQALMRKALEEQARRGRN